MNLPFAKVTGRSQYIRMFKVARGKTYNLNQYCFSGPDSVKMMIFFYGCMTF